MYVIEGPAHGFTSIPKGIYWAVVTLTTVGFGDIVPKTPLGQALSTLVMITGYSIIAVPTGIFTAELAAAMRADGEFEHPCPGCKKNHHEQTAAFCSRCGPRGGGPRQGRLDRATARPAAAPGLPAQHAARRPVRHSLGGGRPDPADGHLVVDRSHSDTRHLAAADPADTGPGHRQSECSHRALRQSDHQPVLGRFYPRSGHGTLEPPQALRPDDPAGRGQSAEPADRRFYAGHRLSQHVGEQHRHHYHDAAHRPVGDRPAGWRERRRR